MHFREEITDFVCLCFFRLGREKSEGSEDTSSRSPASPAPAASSDQSASPACSPAPEQTPLQGSSATLTPSGGETTHSSGDGGPRLMSPHEWRSPPGSPPGTARANKGKNLTKETEESRITIPGGSVLSAESISSARERRRFRRRDQQLALEESGVQVRPGKTDKSTDRKSVLNVPKDGEPGKSAPKIITGDDVGPTFSQHVLAQCLVFAGKTILVLL